MRRALVIKAVAALTAVVPLACLAESNFQSGVAAPMTAQAHVDFQITIPKFLFLRIGTGTGTFAGGWATNATVDLITWAPTVAQLGTGPLLSAGGDIVGGGETAVIVANNGNVTFTSHTGGPLTDATGDTISWSTITTNWAHLNTGTTLVAPGLADVGTPSIVIAATNGVVDQDAKWTFNYSNAATTAA